MAQTFHSLNVNSVINETADTVSLSFDIPATIKDQFQYKAGQFITLKFQIDGKEERRSYSMCSAPFEKEFKVAVKRVENGIVSNHIFNHVKAGTKVEVSPPEGRFYHNIEEEKSNSIYLIGAGSGITPLMSILKSILEEEPKSYVFLLYGNKDQDHIIFKNELAILNQTYKGQLFVEHVLSRSELWRGMKGRINNDNLKIFKEKFPARSLQEHYYICGPGDMIEMATESLIELGVDNKNIHREYFTTATDDANNSVVGTISAKSGKIIAHLNGEKIEIENNGKMLTQQLTDAGHDAPFSCSSGSCATCICKVISGSVEMEVCYALDDEEIEDGFVLACQSKMVSDSLEISFDDV